jgi:hypothetical protein
MAAGSRAIRDTLTVIAKSLERCDGPAHLNEVPTIAEIAEFIRSELTPHWLDLHQGDLRFGRSQAVPAPLSTAMCRHTALYAERAFAAAGIPGWRAVGGGIRPGCLLITPGYAKYAALAGAEYIEHCWLEHDDGRVLDLTADQFGLDPLTAETAEVAGARLIKSTKPRALFASIKRTVLNWEGDPQGAWPDRRLAMIRKSRSTMIARIAHARARPILAQEAPDGLPPFS